MPEPFFNRLKEYYSKVGEVLRGEASAASIFPNAVDIGMSRERVYMEVLRQHVPSCCNIALGGFLFDQDGNESRQMDLILSNNSSMQFNFHNPEGSGKSFACIDGCVAVACIKSRLGSRELTDCLDNIASIPDKQPLTPQMHSPFLRINNYDEWPYKVVYASDGVGRDTLMDSLTRYFTDHADIPVHKRPSVVHVAGKYVIIRTGQEGGETRTGASIEPNTFYAMTETTDGLGLMWTIMGIQAFALSSQHVFCRYDKLLDNIPF